MGGRAARGPGLDFLVSPSSAMATARSRSPARGRRAGRAVVLLDDVASTGRTLVGRAQALLARGAATVDVAVTHGLFIGDALDQLRAAGVRHVWSTDSVPHASNCVSVVPLLLADRRCRAAG
jgi:phosphoribosylpyrophosphate synthetase